MWGQVEVSLLYFLLLQAWISGCLGRVTKSRRALMAPLDIETTLHHEDNDNEKMSKVMRAKSWIAVLERLIRQFMDTL